MNRREMLATMGAAALMQGLVPAAMAQGGSGLLGADRNVHRRYAPYDGMMVIDGCGGLGRGDEPDGDLGPLALADGVNSGVTAAIITVAPNGRFWFGEEGYQTTLNKLDYWDRHARRHPSQLHHIRTLADLQHAKQEKKFGLIYGFQDTSPIGEDLDRIPMYQRRGVRVIQLTHNRRNLVGDGAMEAGNAGLSNFGHEVIQGLEANRIVVDIAHGGRRTTLEGIQACKRPMLLSHTGCAAISDVPRCMPDEVLRAMADRGGVAGMVFWPYLTRHGQPMAEDLIGHIEHAINVCGEDHVGIGTDAVVSAMDRTPEYERQTAEWVRHMVEMGWFEQGNMYTFIPDLNHIRRLETLGALLSQRGHSQERIGKILGGNFHRVMGEIWG